MILSHNCTYWTVIAHIGGPLLSIFQTKIDEVVPSRTDQAYGSGLDQIGSDQASLIRLNQVRLVQVNRGPDIDIDSHIDFLSYQKFFRGALCDKRRL